MPRFHRKPVRRRSRKGGWRRLLPLALTLVLVGAWVLFEDRIGPRPKVSEVASSFGLCGEGWGACVVDGDTVRIGERRIRLTGFDAPEMDGACEAERVKAREARTALHQWLSQGRFSWTGGQDPPRDRYGRELREVRRGEEALADHMIAAGLAEGSGWGAVRRDWCAP
ncbi:thermonuclease family protein [Qipengyuania seohaensis]|uniref:thermonuclease family protein n=1 Tax=Qipengyuania seohaensis TaxID=266951 RepID=UPI0012FD3223|nr:thermonuclease family protein [Qipengyuania seohaensis]